MESESRETIIKFWQEWLLTDPGLEPSEVLAITEAIALMQSDAERMAALEGQLADKNAGIIAQQKKIERYREALERIRDADYRGNRSNESEIARISLLPGDTQTV